VRHLCDGDGIKLIPRLRIQGVSLRSFISTRMLPEFSTTREAGLLAARCVGSAAPLAVWRWLHRSDAIFWRGKRGGRCRLPYVPKVTHSGGVTKPFWKQQKK
jgi:hypothetical protein